MHTHFEETLQRDIERIRNKVTEMAGLVELALKNCMQALTERNRQVAYSVILRDQRVDELEKEIDRLCLEFIVRQQPVAGTLRFAYATIKVNVDLERVGDYAESMARHILALCDLEASPVQARITEMAALAIPMLNEAVRAFVDQDPDRARRAIVIEDKVDDLRHRASRELISLGQSNQIPLATLFPMMTLVNRLERAADQAKNICQEVLYMCTGEYAKHQGTEVFRVLFVDEHNSCSSQMAEGIGNSLGQAKFIFASAGLEPVRLDQTTVSFLGEKGIDISRNAPRSLEQVPHCDHYQVIVALSEEARKAFPAPPSKVVCLDWSMKDPSQVHGGPDQVRAAYEETYQFLRGHLQDLVQAILGDGKNQP
jgi:phosphate transport system protein